MNAGNKGFNTFSKYPRADFICCNETEIRTEMRAKQAELKKLISEIVDRGLLEAAVAATLTLALGLAATAAMATAVASAAGQASAAPCHLFS